MPSATRIQSAQGRILDGVDTIDEYISGYPEELRVRLERLRQRIHAAVPGAGEAIRYSMPTITLDGSSLVHFAAWKKHIAMYPVPTGDDAFERDVAAYRAAKDAVHFPHREPIPYELVDRLVAILVARR